MLSAPHGSTKSVFKTGKHNANPEWSYGTEQYTKELSMPRNNLPKYDNNIYKYI